MNILLSTPYDWAIFHKCFLPKFMMQLCIIIHGILNLQSKFGCNYKSVNYFNGTSLKVWKFESFIFSLIRRRRVLSNHQLPKIRPKLKTETGSTTDTNITTVTNTSTISTSIIIITTGKMVRMVKQPLPPIRLLIEEPYIHRTLYFSEFASKTTFFQNCHFLLSGFDFVYFIEAPN